MTFRSEDMKHYTLIVPKDNAYSTISQIAQLQNAHFVDCGDNLNRHHQVQLKRIEQLHQYIGIMKHALKMENLSYQQYDRNQKDFHKKLYQIWETQAKMIHVQDVKLIDYYEHQILDEYHKYKEIFTRLEKLKARKKQVLQKIAVSETIHSFFGQSNLRQQSNEYYNNYVNENMQNLSGVSYLVGVIDRESQGRFNKMIYRISRGYACTRSLDYFNFPSLQFFQQKVVMVIYPSTTTAVLQKKINKVVTMFCNSVTSLDTKSQSQNNLQNSKNQFNQVEHYINLNQNQLKQHFKRISQVGCLDKWTSFIYKQKCIYETLNKLQVRGQLMLGNVYVPKKNVKQLSIQISKIVPSPTLQQAKLGKPPTAFATNDYTTIAQDITDTYGVPRYKQMNPSIFTTITFPFFFGVMFGDIGHGGLLFAFGLYLVFNNQKVGKLGGAFSIFSRLRYMITLMGFFAFYCGWIYNDLIGFNYNFFGSCYDPTKEGRVPQKDECVYPFGIDPIWGRAENQLVYINSLKMKISVIIAIIHMTFGIIVKAMNSLYFKKKLDFYFQFIPQIIFMVGLFGYMDFLIIFKWLKPWDQTWDSTPPTQWAPSIISTMMNIGLAMGKTSAKPDGNSSMWGQYGHSSQDTIQFWILVAAFICIPWMLLPKPLIQISHMKKKKHVRDFVGDVKPSILQSLDSENSLEQSLMSSRKKNGQFSLSDSEQSMSPILQSRIQGDQPKQNQGHEDAGEIFVHQLIETIQFALGAVSNTASYLRLWALSLAHSQLANVFFDKTLKNSLQMQGLLSAVPNIITFWILCWITFGVLMCMDSMECFLHSLRLHWVEFQNKFYKGDGYRYEPVSLRLYLNAQYEQESN